MEKIVILHSSLPQSEIEQAEEKSRNYDYICSGYSTEVLEPYCTRDYLRQKHLHDHKVHAVIDRNIMSRLTCAAHNGEIRTEEEYKAIVLLFFLNIAEVEIDPGISLAEYSDSYHSPHPEQELKLLRKIDNIPNDNLRDLALGITKRIQIKQSDYKGKVLLKWAPKRGEDIY